MQIVPASGRLVCTKLAICCGPDHDRHERLDLHRRAWIEVVTVAVEPISEAAERERAEIQEQHREIDQGDDPADHGGAQRQEREHADREREHLHLEEVRLRDRLHADVVIQRVDLGEILPVVAGDDLIRVHVEREPLGVLRRHQADAPQRQRAAEEQQDDRREQQPAARCGSPGGRGCGAWPRRREFDAVHDSLHVRRSAVGGRPVSKNYWCRCLVWLKAES